MAAGLAEYRIVNSKDRLTSIEIPENRLRYHRLNVMPIHFMQLSALSTQTAKPTVLIVYYEL